MLQSSILPAFAGYFTYSSTLKVEEISVLRNVGGLPPDYTTLRPRTQYYSMAMTIVFRACG
jgi:hypothetical protein